VTGRHFGAPFFLKLRKQYIRTNRVAAGCAGPILIYRNRSTENGPRRYQPFLSGGANMIASGAVSRVPAEQSTATRIARYDWGKLAEELNNNGCAILDGLISSQECRLLAAMYPEEEHFRSHIHMARHGFGKGEYRYFKYPLPDLIGGLRTALYPHLANVA